MATATTKPTTFNVLCPFCSDADASVTLDLNDVGTCRCSSCDEEFTPRQALAKAMALAARWEAVCQWVEMAKELANNTL